MTRARDNRLARLAEAAANKDAAESSMRCISAAWRKVCAMVREELMRSGIDPAQVTALRLSEAHDALETAPAGEKFVLKGADDMAAVFALKIGNLARQFEGGRQPNFAKASMAELFAWSLSRRARARGST